MIAIIDYGVGNLFSLQCSFQKIGSQVLVTSDQEIIRRADKLVLPGVGAFEDAAQKLQKSGLAELVKKQAAGGKPLLGICLGMQLLFERSYEYGVHEGLGLLKGEVIAMNGTIPSSLPIPHMGWNSLQIKQKSSPLFRYIKDRDYVYFVHSFYASGCEESLAASTEYGIEMTAAVAKNNIYGCQFHPEKSGQTGLDILRAFSEMEA